MERDQINTRTWVTQAERDQKNYEYYKANIKRNGRTSRKD